MIKRYVLYLISLLLSSCSLIDISNLVISSVPSHSGARIAPTDNIQLHFNKSIRHYDVENLIYIETRGERQSLDFHWTAKSLSIESLDGFYAGNDYLLVLEGQLRDHKSRSYAVNKNLLFSVEGPSELPQLVSFTPASASLVAASTGLEFYFSTPIKTDYFDELFNIDTVAELDFAWDLSKKQLSVRPRNQLFWAGPAVYQWSIDSGLANSSATQFSTRSYSGFFQVGEDLVRPSVVAVSSAVISANSKLEYSIDSSGLRTDSALLVSFSEAMDLSPTRDALSFSPAKTGQWFSVSPAKFLYVPTEFWEGGQEYILQVAKTARDLQHNELEEAYEQKLSVVKSDFIRLKVLGRGDSDIQFKLDAPYLEQEIDIINDGSYEFSIEFSQAYSAAKKAKVEDSIIFVPFFPHSLANPQLKRRIWLSDSKLIISYTGLLASSDSELHRYNIYKLQINVGLGSLNQQGNNIAAPVTLFLASKREA